MRGWRGAGTCELVWGMIDDGSNRMNSYARWLFGIAGLFNIAVGAALVFAQRWLMPMLRRPATRMP